MCREMKDSGIEWIGKIPKEWEVIRTKNIYSNPKSIVGDKADNYDRLALTLNGVIKRSKEDSNGLQPEKFEGYQILKENELVFKLIDLENVATSRVGLSPYTGLVSPAYIILDNEEHSKFGYYYFISMYYQKIFNKLGGDGVRSNLNAKDLLNIPYLNIIEEERIKISNYLDKKVFQINGIISKQKILIEKYKAYKQSLITETVTKGLNKNVPMKDSGIEWIGEIPSHWNINALNQIFYQVKCKNTDLSEQNLLSLSYGKIIRKNINTNEGLLPDNFSGYNIIEGNDIVLRLTDLQNDHTSLRVGLSRERGIITSAYITLRNRSMSIADYLYYYLHSFDIYKGFYGMGSGVRQGLTYDGIKYMKILIPPIEEQKEIVSFLNNKVEVIEDFISSKIKLIEKLESYKKSLIYECVTGKREVN